MTEDDADDARDLIILGRIKIALRFLAAHPYNLASVDALGALKACALGIGNANIEHMVDAIITGQALTGEDLAERIQAFIDLDEEEKAERAFRAACEAEAEA